MKLKYKQGDIHGLCPNTLQTSSTTSPHLTILLTTQTLITHFITFIEYLLSVQVGKGSWFWITMNLAQMKVSCMQGTWNEVTEGKYAQTFEIYSVDARESLMVIERRYEINWDLGKIYQAEVCRVAWRRGGSTHAEKLGGKLAAQQSSHGFTQSCRKAIGEEINGQKLVLREKSINLAERNSSPMI